MTTLTLLVSGQSTEELIANLFAAAEELQGKPVNARAMRRKSKAKPEQEEPTPEQTAAEADKANGLAEEDTVIKADGTADLTPEEALVMAIDKLEAIFFMDAKKGETPQQDVLDLLPKYGVESLREVAVEKANELLADAEKLATKFGKSN